MSVAYHLYYKGENGNAKKFALEMEISGLADAIRAEEGNLRYEYSLLLNDPETLLLVDVWRDQAALDAHHHSPLMEKLSLLREKFDLHMTAERWISEEAGAADAQFIRK